MATGEADAFFSKVRLATEDGIEAGTRDVA